MKKSIVISLLLLLISWSGYNAVVANSQHFIDNKTTAYQEVTVHSGDSLWKIAARHVSNNDDIRDLIWAIRQVNHLNNNAEIYPGQILKIPAARN